MEVFIIYSLYIIFIIHTYIHIYIININVFNYLRLLEDILEILKPYLEMTKILSVNTNPTLNLVYPSMSNLIKKLEHPEYNENHYAEILFGPLGDPSPDGN